LWRHSLKVAQLLRSAACLHKNQSRSYLNHLVLSGLKINNYALYRYLTTGRSFTVLLHEYLLRASVRDIVRGTCDATWKCLKQAYVSAREENYWMRIANKFYERKNFVSA